MDDVVTFFTKLLSSSEAQPLLENLKKQNEQFLKEETKLLLEDGGSEGEDDVEENDDLEGDTPKDLAMSMLTKVAKLFEFTSMQDKCVLFAGTIFTIIHAASFPILAILFGKISNAYIAHTLLEMKNTTLHPPHNATNHTVGATGALTLSLLTKITSKVNPKMNASVIPTAEMAGGGSGYFGNISLYNSNGTETTADFADYVVDFSFYFVYIGITVFIVSFFQTLTWEWVAENQLYRIKQKFVYQLPRQEMTFFTKHTAGSIVLKLADDCERFREGVGQKFSLVIEYISIALFGAGIGLITNAKLTLVFLASAPFIMTKLLLLWKKIADKSAVAQKEYAKAGKICAEVLMGIRGVIPLSGERKEIKRYQMALSKGAKAADRVEMLVGIGIGGMYLLIYSFYAVALWYAVNLLAEGVITPGEIYTVFFSLTICAFAIGSLLPFVNSIAASYASKRLLEIVLDSEPKIDPYSPAGERPKNFTGRIRFINVSFAYPSRMENPVYDDLKLDIPPSGTVAIVGPCSAGKSTLINLLLRFYDPQKGHIKFDNYDLRSLNVRWVREQIAVVEQNAVLIPGTILDNIRGGRREIRFPTVLKAAKLSLAHDFIMKLPNGYNTKIKLAGGKDLSIGQRQRICIARSILQDTKILIMDEAMSAIDVMDATKIEQNLAKLRTNGTTIVIAHKLAVAKAANKIFVLQDGGVAEAGVHGELMELKGSYYQMWQHENLVQEIHRAERAPSVDSNACAEADAERELIAEFMKASKRKPERTGGKIQDEKIPEDEDIYKDIPSIRKVMRMFPHKAKYLTLGLFGCVLSGLVIPALALCLGRILDMFLGDKDNLFLLGIFYVEILLGLAVMAGIGYCLRTISIGIVGEQLGLSLRVASYEGILRQPLSWFDFEANSAGLLYARLASDIPFIRNAIGARLGTAISAVITLLSALIIATIYGWQLALIASFIILILIVGYYSQKRVMGISHQKVSYFRKKMIKFTNNVIKNMVSIQSSSRAFRICKQAEAMILPALQEGQKRAVSYAFYYSVSEGIMFLTFAAAFRLGAELIRTGILTIPDLFTVFFVITFGSLSLGQATSFVPEYLKARLSASFIFNLIELKSPTDPFDRHGREPEIVGNIEFRDVVFSYPLIPEIKILQGLNLTIPAGKTIGIAGPAGCGKSTVLSILERFYEIESGEVLIDGVNIKDINLQYLRENTGYVAQEPILFDMTIKENIIYGYQGNAVDDELRVLVENAAMAADADFIVDELPEQYETRCGEQGKNLNPGQRQEVALARAIIKNPPILLLDDPTSSLDAKEEKEVIDAMSKMCLGRTTILVSNSYAAIKHCDYIAVLMEGKILEFGPQRELLRNKGFYYQFVRAQGVKILEEDMLEDPTEEGPA